MWSSFKNVRNNCFLLCTALFLIFINVIIFISLSRYHTFFTVSGYYFFLNQPYLTLSLPLSIHPSILQVIHPSVCPTNHLSFSPSCNVSVHHLSIYPSYNSFIHPSIQPSIHPSITEDTTEKIYMYYSIHCLWQFSPPDWLLWAPPPRRTPSPVTPVVSLWPEGKKQTHGHCIMIFISPLETV